MDLTQINNKITASVSRSLSSDSPGELHVLGHDSDPLSMDGTEVGVLKQSDEVGLSSFLQRQDSLRLETEVRLELSGDFSDQSLEWKFPDQ